MITIEMTVRFDETHRDYALIRASLQSMFTGIMGRAGCDGGSFITRESWPFSRLPDAWPYVDPMPGKYWKDKDGSWYAWTPNGILAGLSKHQVTEHEDGSITVSPSIQAWDLSKTYHGYLERGQWRDA